MTTNEDEIARAIHKVVLSQNPDENSVVDALYAIARSLDRIGAALDGPWPSALAEALAREGGLR